MANICCIRYWLFRWEIRLATQIILVMGACVSGFSIAPGVRADDGSRRWSTVEKWMVEAESNQLPTGQATEQRSEWSTCRVIAASTDDEIYYFVGHKQEVLGTDWRNEPFNLEITFQGGQQISNHKFIRKVDYLSIPKGSQVPSPLQSDTVSFFFPSWPLKSYPPPSQNGMDMILFVGAALGSGAYRSTSNSEVICGELCTEFASPKGNDRIWIANGKDLCVMRRDWFYLDTMALAGQIRTNRIAQVSDGLWLPVEVECLAFERNVSGGRPVPRSRTLTSLSNWKFDKDVPASIFQPSLRPGMIEVQKNGDLRQLSPGGIDLFNDIADFYRGPIRLPHRTTTSKKVVSGMIRFLVGCVGGLFLGLFIGRSLRPWNSSSKIQL